MFLDELSKITGLPISETFHDYKIINIGGKVIYVQNYIKLLTYNQEQIVLKIKNNELVIDGKDLKIAELGEKNILVKGHINKSYLSKESIGNETSKWPNELDTGVKTGRFKLWAFFAICEKQ